MPVVVPGGGTRVVGGWDMVRTLVCTRGTGPGHFPTVFYRDFRELSDISN